MSIGGLSWRQCVRWVCEIRNTIYADMESMLSQLCLPQAATCFHIHIHSQSATMDFSNNRSNTVDTCLSHGRHQLGITLVYRVQVYVWQFSHRFHHILDPVPREAGSP